MNHVPALLPSLALSDPQGGCKLLNVAQHWMIWHGVVAALTEWGCIGLFVVGVWEPLSSIGLAPPFLAELKRHDFTTKQRALGFQKDGWSCGFQSPHIASQEA